MHKKGPTGRLVSSVGVLMGEDPALERECFQMVMEKLKMPRCDTRMRFLAVLEALLCEEPRLLPLWKENLTDIVQMTVGLDKKAADLPQKPKSVNPASLQKEGLAAIERWAEEYGNQAEYRSVVHIFNDYKRLGFAFPQDTARQKKAAAQQLLREQYDAFKIKWNAMIDDTRALLQEMDTCFGILVPQYEAVAAAVSEEKEVLPTNPLREESTIEEQDDFEDTDDDTTDSALMHAPSHVLRIVVPKTVGSVEVDDDVRQTVTTALQDLLIQLQSDDLLHAVKSDGPTVAQFDVELHRSMQDLLDEKERSVGKCKKLGIKLRSQKRKHR